jgi:hypothetical protein
VAIGRPQTGALAQAEILQPMFVIAPWESRLISMTEGF